MKIPLSLSRYIEWCKDHPLWASGIGAVAAYWIGFRIYYCSIEGCTHPANWWFHLEDEPQATWLGSLGALTAVWWGFFLFSRDRREKRELARKRAMPVAEALYEELQGVLDHFARLGAESSEATLALQLQIKKGAIGAIGIPNLEGASTNLAFLECISGEDVDQLFTALHSIRRYNEFAGKQGANSGDAESAAGDLLSQYHNIKREVDELRAALSKYQVLPQIESRAPAGHD